MKAKDVKLQNLSKVYPARKGTGKDVYAVDNISLDIQPGEFVTLLGPSGCGKTTTLRMIAGFERPTGGDILLGDKSIRNLSPDRRDTAMVFQTYALFPNLNVYDNISYGLKIKKLPAEAIRKKVGDILDLTGLTGLQDRHTNELSGGQQQRVALARALVMEPGVLLFDEPLSNLDAKLRTSMRTEIIKLHKKLATTFIYVTHDQTEAMTMGDRIVVMKDGLIQQVDTPQNLYDYPCNIFVAGFIGSPQMNFLDGTLKKNGDQFTVDLAGTDIPLPKEKTADGKLDAYVGKTLKVGIRPEDIKDDEEFLDKHPNSHIGAEVEVSELMGAEIYLYLTYQGQNLMARVAPTSKSRRGDKITVAMDTHKIHLFDPETEKTLLN